MPAQGQKILLIDDEQVKLVSLADRVRRRVKVATVCTWNPREDEDPSIAFGKMAGDDTVLVVTDLDLTKSVKGLFGHSVVAWCRSRFIPVGDFSRGRPDELPLETDLFELRVPRGEADAVACIARMFEGFRRIRESIEQDSALLSEGRNPGQVLACVLGRNDLESQLGPYLSRPGLFNASLLDTLATVGNRKGGATEAKKIRLLTYILGHMLVNAVLKYPGPILAEGPLCAYVAASNRDIDKLAELFESARYTGPFGDGERLFWRDKVDDVVEGLARDHEIDDSGDGSFGDYHRAVVDAALEGSLVRHGCSRCGGVKGGFWCPHTKRAVCERGDCSSTASSWVPSGAYACRIERDYFDEWSPILGL